MWTDGWWSANASISTGGRLQAAAAGRAAEPYSNTAGPGVSPDRDTKCSHSAGSSGERQQGEDGPHTPWCQWFVCTSFMSLCMYAASASLYVCVCVCVCVYTASMFLCVYVSVYAQRPCLLCLCMHDVHISVYVCECVCVCVCVCVCAVCFWPPSSPPHPYHPTLWSLCTALVNFLLLSILLRVEDDSCQLHFISDKGGQFML